MTVFKTFLKVLNKNKAPILLYTIFLIAFGGLNMTTSDNSLNFTASKPDVYILNEDEEVGVTKNLLTYLSEQYTIKEIDPSTLDDALFYRDVNFIIHIPKGYRQDFLAHKNPEIEMKSTGDYQASLANMTLEAYLKVASIYNQTSMNEETLIKKINQTLDKKVDIQVTSKVDTESLEKIAFYYNFANYALLAGCVYTICLILTSFKQEAIQKRTTISSMNNRQLNQKLLVANSLFALVLWAFYVLLSFVLFGDAMISLHGIGYILNSFVFTFVSLTIAFLIGNLIQNKGAINGIINVVALGSSFLCGAFVPMDFLPDSVVKFSHVLPSYWYILTNDTLKTIEVFHWETIRPLVGNSCILLGFALLFILLTNWITKKRRKKN